MYSTNKKQAFKEKARELIAYTVFATLLVGSSYVLVSLGLLIK